MIKLADKYVDIIDDHFYNCNRCGEPFGTTDDLDIEGDWDCVIGTDGYAYHSGCCVEAPERNNRMRKFRVGVSYEGSVIVEVEARDEDAACEKAESIVENMSDRRFNNEIDLQHAETNIIGEIKDE